LASTTQTAYAINAYLLGQFAFAKSTPNRHTTQSGDFDHPFNSTSSQLASNDSSQQSATSLIQLNHHSVYGTMVLGDIRLPVAPTLRTSAPDTLPASCDLP